MPISCHFLYCKSALGHVRSALASTGLCLYLLSLRQLRYSLRLLRTFLRPLRSSPTHTRSRSQEGLDRFGKYHSFPS